LFRSEKCFRTTQELEYFFLMAQSFFPEFNIRLYYEYLIKYKLIHPNQSGFRSKHSCVTALTKIVDHILIEMDQGNYTGFFFLILKRYLTWLIALFYYLS
jgi:hypothetical protein